MKGKVLSIITAVLFGATMLASPILYAADTTGAAGMEEQAPAKKAPKKKATKKKATKKKATAKKTTKKKSSKTKAKAPAEQPE